MKRENTLFVRLLLASMLFHLGMLPLFSLVLPPKKRMYRTIEVEMLKPAQAPQTIPVVRRPEPPAGFPRMARSAESLAVPEPRDIIRRALGEERRVSGSNVLAVAGVPDAPFTVQYPDLPMLSYESEGGSPSIVEEITGPGGLRGVRYRERIAYPDWAQRRGVEGNVRLKFWVNPDGRVADSEIVTSSGFPEMDILLQEGLRRWLFEPAPGTERVWGIILFRLRLR